MAVQVLMPQFGESVEEATLTRWLKAVGDQVEEYEPLVEVNTDKVDTEIPSPAGGVLLEILVQEGKVARAGDLLAVIGELGEQIEQITQPASHAPADSVKSSPDHEEDQPDERYKSGRHPELGFISPIVARLANEENIDLSLVPGSGQAGRVTRQDVNDYLDRSVQEKKPTGKGTGKSPQTATSLKQADAAGVEILPISPLRRTIAERMVFSKHTSPHVTTVMEADLSRVIAHLQANKEAFSRDGARLTFTAYFLAATVEALKAYPIANASWGEQGIIIHRSINLGMATSLGEEGLIVPVIKNAETLSLLGLARAINDLADRARTKKLLPEEVQGGTFTITNHGISGSLFAMPIINQPQCGILGVGAIQKRAVVVQDASGADAIAIRPMCYLSFTFDHRILDGAIADYFLGKVVESLQDYS
jgi:2-oxoisovalerate dehydrogenase E2 component (dihydrolipoyl transacylase)